MMVYICRIPLNNKSADLYQRPREFHPSMKGILYTMEDRLVAGIPQAVWMVEPC